MTKTGTDPSMYKQVAWNALMYLRTFGHTENNHTIFFNTGLPENFFGNDKTGANPYTYGTDWMQVDSDKILKHEIFKVINSNQSGTWVPATLVGAMMLSSCILTQGSYNRSLELTSGTMGYILHKNPEFWNTYDKQSVYQDFNTIEWLEENLTEIFG